MGKYTQKQIEKYNRQKYISEMEKIAKNLFKMFRNSEVNANEFKIKILQLITKFLERDEIRLEGEYNNKLKGYILDIYNTIQNIDFNDIILTNMREVQMSNLNRLQKMKNSSTYKKDKHKSQIDYYD